MYYRPPISAPAARPTQVTQQRLESLGLVFASSAVHRNAAEAWRALGPLSMGRQVVAAMNRQLGELAARGQELAHALGVAQERWRTEEGVRVRLQEQLLELKASGAKLAREKEALEGAAARLERQRDAADASAAELRAALAAAEQRGQAAHRQALEAAGEARRLAPLESRATTLEAGLRGTRAELERAQAAVAAHQASIAGLLGDKAAALERCTSLERSLEAAQAQVSTGGLGQWTAMLASDASPPPPSPHPTPPHPQVRELTAASRDRGLLAEGRDRLQAEAAALRERLAAQERLQADAMRQLVVARQLLLGVHSGEERERSARAEADARRYHAAALAKGREAELLQVRLEGLEQQLAYLETQLEVLAELTGAKAATQAAAAYRSRSISATTGGHGQQQQQQQQTAAAAEQLRRLLALKEERVRHLERLHAGVAASAAQLRQLQGTVAARDATIAELRAEVEAVRKQLHAAQVRRGAAREAVGKQTGASLAPQPLHTHPPRAGQPAAHGDA